MPSTLSDDIRRVGNTLGQVLRTIAPQDTYENVEAMRTAAKDAHEATSEELRTTAGEKLHEVASGLNAAEALNVCRAFTLYFQLVNQAEDLQRVRQLRVKEKTATRQELKGSFDESFASLKARGATFEQVAETLRDLCVEFVFTAHPTEARRRTTERLLAQVRDNLEAGELQDLTRSEALANQRGLLATVEALWLHSSERKDRPDVLDEVKAGLWYLRHVLFDVVPDVHGTLHRALEEVFGPNLQHEAYGELIRFGSWMGGDRDGNPYVSTAITERALEMQWFMALERYAADVEGLVDELAAQDERFPLSPALESAIRLLEASVVEARQSAHFRNPDEPLRRVINLMLERLERTKRFGAGGYHRPEEFLRDIEVLQQALVERGCLGLAGNKLQRLKDRVRSFGFHVASLDIREDARLQRRVVGELLGRSDYEELEEPERLKALAELHAPLRHDQLSEEASRYCRLLASLGRQQSRFGQGALSTFILSMTMSAGDILEALALARAFGVEQHFDFVPLLETPEALSRCRQILKELFQHKAYREHLRARGDVQELLLGYSDSMKEGGTLASRVGVFQAQVEAAQVSDAHGVCLRIFHGRGGSVSRGGGPTYRAIGGLPRSAFSGRIKITEQGEMRAHNFANPRLAARYLEQTVGAAIVARWEAKFAPPPKANPPAVLGPYVKKSQEVYRRFVRNETTLRYYQETTPLKIISELNIGSRPSKRKPGQLQVSHLRAIPWVFAWSQSRTLLTGWFGVGSALSHALEDGAALARLKQLHQDSAFFRDYLDNVHMALAKADLFIAKRYAELSSQPEQAARVFATIEEEFETTRQVVCAISDQAAVLGDDRNLQTSIRLRNPYVDPLSYLQVRALSQLAQVDGSGDDGAWKRVARASVQGISAGLRHTG